MVRIVTIAAVLAAAVATASAQPGPDAPAPAAAPMTNDWSEVSHINGQLVPVGERHEYLKAQQKHFNISTNPIGWLVGFYGITVQGAVTDNITLRGNVEFLDYDFLGHTSGTQLEVGAPIYLRRAFDGPFIEPGYLYEDTMDTPWDLFGDGDSAPVAHHFQGPQILAGWHWTFDSGLNFAVAFGAARNLSEQMDGDGEYASDEPRPVGYMRVGYAF
jgi:hypothetical protein